MSGPKTSEISLEEQIRQQLIAANSCVAASISEARKYIENMRDEANAARNECISLGLSEADAGVLYTFVEERVAKALGDLATIQTSISHLNALTSVEKIRNDAEKLADKARIIGVSAINDLGVDVNRIQVERSRLQRNASAAQFAQILETAFKGGRSAVKTATASAPDNSASVNAPVVNELDAQKSNDLHEWEDLSPQVSCETSRYVKLLSCPEYLTVNAALVLQDSCVKFQTALDAYVANPCKDTHTQLQNELNITRELLPKYESEAKLLHELRTKLFTLDPQAAKNRSSFASVDEAQDYLDLTQATQAQSAQQAYIRACIDSAMRAHGYDVSRSVTMNRANAGNHLIFGNSESQNGVHVFMSDSGDMMMEAVATPEIDAINEGGSVSFEQTTNSNQIENLLTLQNNFCAVYAEIESDLAAHGIKMNTYYKCVPAAQHCKEMHIAEGEGTHRSKTEPDNSTKIDDKQAAGNTGNMRSARDSRRKRRSAKNETRAMR